MSGHFRRLDLRAFRSREILNPKGNNSSNSRNGQDDPGDCGEIELKIPRDLAGTFEPLIVGKHQKRFNGFADKIISLSAPLLGASG